MVAPPRYGALIRSTTTGTPLQVELEVAVEAALVEEQLVLQARAAARLHGDAQPQVVAALLVEQRADLDGGGLGQRQRAWPVPRPVRGGELDGRGLAWLVMALPRLDRRCMRATGADTGCYSALLFHGSRRHGHRRRATAAAPTRRLRSIE